MAYTSFLVERFETTHENIFFRLVDQELRKKFEKEEHQYILIGNISVEGRQLDAVLLKTGGVLVIDFKDYQGDLVFSENGVWRVVTKEKDTIFVKGGAISRNPFQQVSSYRYALMKYLSTRNDQILEPNHIDINWSHISSIVFFQRRVNYNKESIPVLVQRYFHICDISTYLNLFESIYSNELFLSNKELFRILDILNVDINKPYIPAEVVENVDEKVRYNVNNMKSIKRLLFGTEKMSLERKIVSFYNTMIAIERSNEADLTGGSNYPLNHEKIENDYSLDLTINNNFYNLVAKNNLEKFPKSLFVGLNVSIDDKVYPLFHEVISFTNIENQKDIKIDFNDFSLFSYTLNKLEISEDIEAVLREAIESEVSIIGKLSKVSEILDISLSFLPFLTIGLSSQSMFTAQLQSELNSIIRKRVFFPEKGSVLHGTITGEKIDYPDYQELENIVQITSLNQSQRKAVELAFKEPVSIITGPPGTGKSQVVVNILANAVLNNQKVLFASKNNQAVDNVHERLRKELDSDYFIRLGNSECNQQADKDLSVILNAVQSGFYKKDEELFLQNEAACKKLKNKLDQCRFKVEQIPILKEALQSLSNRIENERISFERIKNKINIDYRRFFIKEKLEINVSNSNTNFILNSLESTKSIFGKVVFYLFKKKKIYKQILEINASLPDSIRGFVDDKAPISQINKRLIDSLRSNVDFIKNLQENQKIIVKLYQEHEGVIDCLQNNYNEKKVLYQSYLAQEKESLKEIESLEPLFVFESKKLMKSAIARNLQNINNVDYLAISAILQYQSYLKNKLPWKDSELSNCSLTIKRFLDVFKGVSISNLTIKNSFLLEQNIFDLVVIDEASQCDFASVIPLLFRAKRVCILGDPLQLKHITSITKGEQQYVLDELRLEVSKHNYCENSLFDKMSQVSIQNRFESSFLNEHYRCHPDIIGFSNEFFYKKEGQSLSVQTNANDFKFGDIGFNWIDVNGKVLENKNINNQEVEACLSLYISLKKRFPKAKIGIATPFKHQKEALQNAFKNLNIELRQDLIVDTVHRFQGDEKDIIIFSLVVTSGCKDSLPNFINKWAPYLLNVGVTRAKSALYIIGNKEYCKSLKSINGSTLLRDLVVYSDTINELKGKSSYSKQEKRTSQIVNEEMIVYEQRQSVSNISNRIIEPMLYFNSIVDLIDYCIEKRKVLEIEYSNKNGLLSKRVISNLEYSKEFTGINDNKAYISANCHLRNEVRTFKLSNIRNAIIL